MKVWNRFLVGSFWSIQDKKHLKMSINWKRFQRVPEMTIPRWEEIAELSHREGFVCPFGHRVAASFSSKTFLCLTGPQWVRLFWCPPCCGYTRGLGLSYSICPFATLSSPRRTLQDSRCCSCESCLWMVLLLEFLPVQDPKCSWACTPATEQRCAFQSSRATCRSGVLKQF